MALALKGNSGVLLVPIIAHSAQTVSLKCFILLKGVWKLNLRDENPTITAHNLALKWGLA